MRYYMLVISIIVALITGLSSIVHSSPASDRKRAKKNEQVNRQKVSETYLDTLNRGQELSLIEYETPSNIEEPSGTNETKKTVDGFRIQLVASTSLEKLRAKKDDLESELKLKIYIEHDEPYYKVYAGDFIHRNKADKALAEVKDSGYPDAWIVKTKVFADK